MLTTPLLTQDPLRQAREQANADFLQWQNQSQDIVDRMALDWDGFATEHDTSFLNDSPDPTRMRKLATVGAYLRVANAGQPLGYEHGFARDAIARQRFNGRGLGSDNAFFAEIHREASERKDARALHQDLASTASRHQLLTSAGDERAVESDWLAWKEANRGNPAFDRASEPELMSAWLAERDHVAELTSPFEPELTEVWKGFRSGQTNFFQVADAIPEEDREGFKAALAMLARSLPDEEKPAFWTNLRKQAGRDFTNIAISGIGGSFRAADEFREAGLGGPSRTAEEQIAFEREQREDRRRVDFIDDIRTLAEQDYNPVTPVPGGLPDWIERGIYAAPGVTATTAIALVPYAGQIASFSIIREDFYQTTRRDLISKGVDPEAARTASEDIATIAAVPAALLERVGARGVTGQLPGLNRVLTRAADTLGRNAAARFATRATAGAAFETGVETVQDLMAPLVQDVTAALSEDLPGVDWGETLAGSWSRIPETFVAILPLAIVGAGVGIGRDRRNATFAAATDLELKAFGFSESRIREIRDAHGVESLDEAITAGLAERDDTTEGAIGATQELAESVTRQRQAIEDAQRTGVLPRFQRTGTDWTLYDSETGEEIGRAPNHVGALRLAIARTESVDREDAEEIARLASLLEAGDIIAEENTDTNQTTTDLQPGRTLTEAEAAAESTQNERQIYEQTAAAEALGQETGMARIVLGQSHTEFAQGVRQSVNRIFNGASVLTVFHEDAHGRYRAALQSGRLTKEDTVSFLRGLDTVLAGRQGLRFLPETVADAELTDTQVDEAVAELMEAEILRTRKGGGKRKLSPGLVSKSLSAVAKLAGPETAKKFGDFLRAMRAYFGQVIRRAHALRKGLSDGTVDRAEYDSFLNKLLNLDEQADFDQMAREAESAILDGADLAPLATSDPFSLGRSPVPIALPEAIIGHPLGDLTNHPDYQAAKGGDPLAAARLADAMVNPELVAQVREQIGEKQPSIVPVLAIEQAGRNKIPLAVALKLGHELSLDVSTDIIQTVKANRSAASGLDRVFIASEFAGEVQSGADYLIVDDTLTQGGTFAALADHITRQGGNVIATVALTGKNYSRTLTLSDETLQKVRERLGDLEPDFREATGHGFDALTESEARTLATWKPLDAVRSRIAQERNEASGRRDEAADGLVDPPSYSLGPAALAATLRTDATSRIRDPERRANVFQRIARQLDQLHADFDRLELTIGNKRLKKSLLKEGSMREALRVTELENEAYARHFAILQDEDLAKLSAQPLHAYFSKTKADGSPDPLHGRIESRASAERRMGPMFSGSVRALYDDAAGVSPTVFGGTLTPDQAATEAHEAGLIREATPEALWNGLARESQTVAQMKAALAAAREDIRRAKTQAKQETTDWLIQEGAVQATEFSEKQEILRALATYDAILSAFPAEIRGKLGGYTQLARLGSNETRLAFLKDRLAKLDAELETYLRAEYDTAFRAILDRARPQKAEPGQKATGVLTPDIHAAFDLIRTHYLDDRAKGEALANQLDARADLDDITAAEQGITTEQQILDRITATILRHSAGWAGRSSADRETALINATRLLGDGLGQARIEAAMRRERRARARHTAVTETGKNGTPLEIDKRLAADALPAGKLRQLRFGLYSFADTLRTVFGHDSNTATRFIDWERAASDAKSDAVQNKLDLLDEVLATLAGGRFKGEKLRYDLSQKSMEIDGRLLSEFEAITATLLWQQPDGRRHMIGHLDDGGNPVGSWHYGQTFIDEIESKLSPNAKAIRQHLRAQYSTEYDRLNAVFRDLYGVDLPRVANYAPITVTPAAGTDPAMVDPVTGQTMTGAGLTPGSLRTRSQTAVAEPRFADAVQTYLAHTMQMEHWMAYAPLVTEAMAVLNTREVGNPVTEKAGRESLQVLRDWVEFFTAGGNRDAAAYLSINQRFANATNRLAAAALIGRVSVLAIQSTQLGAGLARMPTASYLKRLAKLTTGQLGWGKALKSDYIQRRLQQMPPALQQAMRGLESSKPNRIKSAIRELGRSIAGADALFTSGTYAIVYDYHYTHAPQNLTATQERAEYARRLTERAVDDIAQPVRPGTRSILENRSTNVGMRLLWAFASESRQKLALSLYAIAEKRSPAEIGRALAVTWLVGGVGAAMVRAALRDLRSDDDDEIFDARNWDPARLAVQSLAGPLGGIPFLGETAETGGMLAIGERPFPDSTLFDAVGKGFQSIMDLAAGDVDTLDESLRIGESIVNAGAFISGTSSALTSVMHVIRDLLGIAENVEGPE